MNDAMSISDVSQTPNELRHAISDKDDSQTHDAANTSSHTNFDVTAERVRSTKQHASDGRWREHFN